MKNAITYTTDGGANVMFNTEEPKMDGIKVEGHRGTWFVIDDVMRDGKTYFLLEHETYGEDADHIAIDENGRLKFDEITDGITEIGERLDEMEEEK